MSAYTPLSDEQEKLVIKNSDYARNVGAQAARNLPKTAVLSYEDCLQEAKIGLIEAARRFDVAKHDPNTSDIDTHFKSFAYPRIRGAVIDASRRTSFVRRRGLERGLSVEMVSLDGGTSTYGEEMPVFQLAAIEGDPDLMIDFQSAMKTLSDRERFIVMSFGAGITGKEIAKQLNITESRVSQISTEAKKKLLKEMS